jgi:hypothetical protein
MGISAALGSSALLPAGLGFRNLLINGAMQVTQRGTSTASITSSGYYTADRWKTTNITTGTWTQSIENDAPTGSGFRKSLKMLCTTADASLGASDELDIRQTLEGQNCQFIKKGTSSAQPLILSFWVKSNVVGNYVCWLYDEDNTRIAGTTYAVLASNAWELKTVTFPADATGAFDNDANASLVVGFQLAAGSNYTSGTLSTAWASYSAANQAVGQVNLAGSTNNYWQITGVQLEQNLQPTPFEQRPIGIEIALCQRYYKKETGLNVYMPATGYTQQRLATVHHGIPLRAAPTTYSFTSTTAMAAYLVVTVGVLSAYNVVGSVSTEIAFTAYEVSAEL